MRVTKLLLELGKGIYCALQVIMHVIIRNEKTLKNLVFLVF
jgi:hypothetical protein